MEFEEICLFLDTTTDKLDASWELQTLLTIANQRVPDFIMSGRGSLLRGDIYLLWTQWLIESICDPEMFTNSIQNYGHIVEAVSQRIPFIFTRFSNDERNKLSVYIARLVNKEVQRRKTRQRMSFSAEIKNFLWDIYSPEPRCWICGYKFSKWAESQFLGDSSNTEPPLPQFIDYMTLHGLIKRDISIEIDHAFPFSKGGNEEDNLRLACGWCNSRKGERVTLYDVAAKSRIVTHPKLGQQSVPHPFWLIRLLSLCRRCEYEGGCDKNVKNSHLTVVPKHPKGAMNPTNLRVICLEHDHIGSNRFVTRRVAEKMRNRKEVEY